MDTKKLRQKILDLAIRGKLVPQDPNDEPASVLLERIRAEKERLIKEGKIKRSKKSASDTPHYENVPFEVPESWEWTTIGEIASSILYGVSESAKENGQYKLLRITDIQNNKVNWETVPFTDYDKNKAQAYLLNDGDILFARTGATVGKSYLVEGLKDSAIYASYLIRVQTSSVILPAYIKFFFESGFYWEQVSLNSVGIGQPNVNGTTLAALTIPIPPYREQLCIVEEAKKWLMVIDGLDVEIEDLRTFIEHTKSKILDLAIHGKLVPQDPNDEPAIELLKRINPKFTPCDNAHYLYGFPISWELAKLEDVCEFIRNGVSIRQIKSANGIPITRIETISNGVVEREKMGYADIEDDTYEKYYLQNGDILMSHINSPIHVGKSALYESIDGEKIIHGMNLLCLRMKDGIYPKYMNHLFKSDFFRDKIRPYIKNAVNQASINTRSLGGVYTPIPSHKEQLRIVAKIEELFTVLDEIQKSIEA